MPRLIIPSVITNVAPTTGDDSADGYRVGTLWVDTVAELFYVAMDVTPAAAVWKMSGDAAALAAHLSDTADAHDASAISFVPAGTIAATNQQAATEEVATDAAAALSAHVADADPHVGYELESQKGIAGGYASLDGGGKIPTAQLPALAITDVWVVADEVAQLALTVEEGDVAVRSDLNKSFIHNGGVAGTMADWQELLTPTDVVLSVFGRTGAVSAVAGDYEASEITATPSGNLAGSTVEAQLVELDTEKVNTTDPVNVAPRIHTACIVASSTNINVAAPGTPIGGIAFVANARYLLVGQTARAENGVWVSGATNGVAMSRPADFTGSTTVRTGDLIPVNAGTFGCFSGGMFIIRDDYGFQGNEKVIGTDEIFVRSLGDACNSVDSANPVASQAIMAFDYYDGSAGGVGQAGAATFVTVTGSATITALRMDPGSYRILRFAGACVLTHSAALELPGAANITTAAGDIAIFFADQNMSPLDCVCISYQRASGAPLIPVQTDGSMDPRFTTEYYHDFDGQNGITVSQRAWSGIVSNASGSGSMVRDHTYSTASHHGLARFGPGLAGGNWGGVQQDANAAKHRVGGAEIKMLCCVLMPTLSNATDEYAYYYGLFGTINPLTTTDGIYITYDRLAYGANYQLVCRAASTNTVVDLGFGPTASTTVFSTPGFIINAAGTSVQGYIDGVAQGAPIITNIPSALIMMNCVTAWKAGTPPYMYADFIYMKMSYTVGR